jgi:putative ABC transport system ATP-binding protein
MLEIRDLVHAYGSRRVLELPRLELATEASCAVAGPSGSGKSTLLAILAGILVPSSGAVLLDGEELYPQGRARPDRWRGARIGLVPQRLHLIASLDALANVRLAQQLAGRDAPQEAIELLGELGLGARLHALPESLSRGEQQRVAVARAVVNRPRLLLADEPTSSLDDANALAAAELLAGTAQRHGALLVVATHDARVLGRFAQVVRLGGGHG